VTRSSDARVRNHRAVVGQLRHETDHLVRRGVAARSAPDLAVLPVDPHGVPVLGGTLLGKLGEQFHDHVRAVLARDKADIGITAQRQDLDVGAQSSVSQSAYQLREDRIDRLD